MKSIILILLSPALLRASQVLVPDLASSTVQAAITAAAEGDTIILPSGSDTWSVQVKLINKALVIRGAGVGLTNITNNVTGAIFSVEKCGSKSVDISGISWVGANTSTLFRIGSAITDSNTNYRLHHMAFTIGASGRGILVFGKSEGVIDHCIFKRDADGQAQGITVWGAGQYALVSGNTNASFPPGSPWTTAAVFGDSHRAFIEDCDFDFSGPNDAGVEGYFGAKYCVRKCTIKNTLIGNHGLDSGVASTHSYEVYQNTWTITNPAANIQFEARGGTGLVWGNKAIGTAFNIKLENYRAVGYAIQGHGASGGFITGANPYDGNQSGVASSSGFDPCGQPALESIGTTGPIVLHGDHADVPVSPFYEWSNTCGVDVCHQSGGSQIVMGPGYTPIRASGNNLVIDAVDNAKVTSATKNFLNTGNNATSDVNSWIHVTSETGFTPGWYQIVSCAGNAATLNHPCGEAGSTWGAWSEEWSAIVPSDIIKENRDYYRTPKSDYSPYQYPHPLATN